MDNDELLDDMDFGDFNGEGDYSIDPDSIDLDLGGAELGLGLNGEDGANNFDESNGLELEESDDFSGFGDLSEFGGSTEGAENTVENDADSNSDFDDFSFDTDLSNTEYLDDTYDLDNSTDDSSDTAESNSFEFDDDKFTDSDGSDDIEIDSADYIDGAIVEDVELHDDTDAEDIYSQRNDFIDKTGNIVVQDSDERENGFELTYIDIDKIAVTRRIRAMSSVESLVKSIKSTGLLEPLVVVETETKGVYVLLSGYRRLQACARAGKTRIPCIVNTHVSTTEVPIIEAMYNHSRKYSIKEQIDYIEYLEKEQGIMNPAMIEYLLQMDSGDYTKLKDILNDNDPDIVEKLYDGAYDIATAFKKLEQRRKKESAEEKESKRADKVYEDTEESGVEKIEGSGDEADGMPLTEEQIESLQFNIDDLDDVDSKSLSEMVQADNEIEGFEPNVQTTDNREYIDPIIKKSVLIRDNGTCQCCKRGGEQYADTLDYHHIKPVMLGGEDTVDNGIMLCLNCHRQVHLYSTGDIVIDRVLLDDVKYDDLPDEKKEQYINEEIFEDEKRKYKRVVELGSIIRKGIAMRRMNRKEYKENNPNTGIGRRKPGKNAEQEKF